MEQATLRPVPLRPSGPVDPREALEHVAATLPKLDEAAAQALALVEIAGRSRADAAEETDLGDAISGALYRARKELRRSIFPLSASGWCERAEHLISDRLDGVLRQPGPKRLHVHLENCDRCNEHERGLTLAREQMVRDFIAAHPHADVPERAPEPRPAGLRIVPPMAVADEPLRAVPSFGGVWVEPGQDDLPSASFAGPGGQVEIVPEPRRAVLALVAETPDSPPDSPTEVEEDPPVETTIAPAEPEPERAPEPEPPAAAQAPPVIVGRRMNGAELLWNVALGAAVFFALVALIVTLLAIAGVDRLF